MTNKLSIIIPAYNVEYYIDDCIKPITLFQELDCEVVIVNDGSTDGTANKLNSLSGDKFKIVHHDCNKGLPAARNTGLKASSGDYIIILDADDIPVTNKWIPLVEILQQYENAVLAYGDLQTFEDGSEFIPKDKEVSSKPSGYCLEKIVLGNSFISVGTAVIRRSFLEKVGPWNESLTIGEDWEMWCRLAAAGDFLYAPGVIVGYRQRISSMTKSKSYLDEDKLKAAVVSIFKNEKIRDKLDSNLYRLRSLGLSNFYFRLMYKAYRFQNPLQAAKFFGKYITYRAASIFYYLNMKSELR